jgi:hypothetical protein
MDCITISRLSSFAVAPKAGFCQLRISFCAVMTTPGVPA